MPQNNHARFPRNLAPASEQLLTKDELANRLKLTRRGVECLVARRLIPVIRISRRCVRFSWDAVKASLEKLQVNEIGHRKTP